MSSIVALFLWSGCWSSELRVFDEYLVMLIADGRRNSRAMHTGLWLTEAV